MLINLPPASFICDTSSDFCAISIPTSYMEEKSFLKATSVNGELRAKSRKKKTFEISVIQ